MRIDWKWIGSAVTVGAVVAAALGFKSPNSRLAAVESDVAVLKPVVAQHTLDNALMKQRLDDYTEGMNRLLDNQGLAKIPKHR